MADHTSDDWGADLRKFAGEVGRGMDTVTSVSQPQDPLWASNQAPITAKTEPLQGFTSNPIPINNQEWAQWPILSQSADPGMADGGFSFPESRGLPEFEASPGDTLASLHSASHRQSSLEGSFPRRNSGAEDTSSGKSFKQLHAERNKQAQRRFRARQKEKITELNARLLKAEDEKTGLERRKAYLESACRLRDGELSKVKARQSMHAEAEEDHLSRAFQGGVTLTYRERETITLGPTQIKDMSDRDLARFWSTYVKEVAVLLVSVEGNPHPPSEVINRIQELVQKELLFLYIRAALTNMQSVKRFIAKAMIEEVRVSAGGLAPTNRWQVISQSLGLSSEQSHEICHLWHGFNDRVSSLLSRRQEIHRQWAIHSGSDSFEAAQKYLQAQELMEQLKKGLRAEHVLIHEFIVTFFMQKLTALQTAKCFVRSFPFYPDVPAIAAWVALSQGDNLALSIECTLRAIEEASPASSS